MTSCVNILVQSTDDTNLLVPKSAKFRDNSNLWQVKVIQSHRS